MTTQDRVTAALRATEASLTMRQEARRLDALANSLFEESEELLRRSTRVRERARQLEELAEEAEDEEEVRRLAGGGPVRARRLPSVGVSSRHTGARAPEE